MVKPWPFFCYSGFLSIIRCHSYFYRFFFPGPKRDSIRLSMSTRQRLSIFYSRPILYCSSHSICRYLSPRPHPTLYFLHPSSLVYRSLISGTILSFFRYFFFSTSFDHLKCHPFIFPLSSYLLSFHFLYICVYMLCIVYLPFALGRIASISKTPPNNTQPTHSLQSTELQIQHFFLEFNPMHKTRKKVLAVWHTHGTTSNIGFLFNFVFCIYAAGIVVQAHICV